MVKTINTPEFKSESEEAAWRAENQSVLLKEFQDAAKDGTLGHGTLMRRGVTPTITIRLDRELVEMARSQAKERGLRYQTYSKMILHQALKREANGGGRL